MVTPNEQLREIQKDLQNKFTNHKHIEVIPFDDDPPEKYEVKYTILGLAQDSEGKVVEAKEHSIFINIPFGFPHFPPSCTPQTPTFHPDFDQAAICIGEFWNKERTLPELIVHIGRMICGEIYSTENAFNDSAVTWYQKIAHQIPFEEVDFSYGSAEVKEEVEEVEEEDIFELPDEELVPHSIDTLDESDISEIDDYFSNNGQADLAEEISFPAGAQPSGKSSVNRIHLLIRQKRYYELSIFLNELPAEEQFEDKDEIESNISNLLKKAKNLQKEADEYEHQGDTQMAHELFEKVASIVPDFPNIQENIDRTKNSIELESEWDTETEELAESVEEPEEQSKPSQRIAFFEETTKTTIKFLPILGAGLVLILGLIFVLPFFSARSHLEEANKLFAQCTQFAKQKQFGSAQRSCSSAEEVLKNISLYKKHERDALLRQIRLTTTSEGFEQGLAGKVFFKGKYVRKTDMDRVLQFNKLKSEADELYAKSLWKESRDGYTDALNVAQPIIESFELSLINEVNDKVSIAEINLDINRGFSLLSRGELMKSKEMFSAAMANAEELPEELGGNLISRIKPKLNEINYLEHLDLGKKYFSTNDWESAIQQYEQALQLRDSTSVATEHTNADSLYENMAEAELFALINNAKNAFSKSNLDGAIKEYQKAKSLLSSKEKLLQRIDPKEIQQQLERIILRTRIVQFKQDADAKLEKQQYDRAIKTLKKVIASVKTSGFQEDEEFKSIINGTENTITETRSKAAISNRKSYLEKNYKKLFQANYSAAIPEYLSEPKVTFLRTEGGKELYELQCLERKQGRKLRLVMFYAYNLSNGNWQFYSEQEQ